MGFSSLLGSGKRIRVALELYVTVDYDVREMLVDFHCKTIAAELFRCDDCRTASAE